MNRHPDRGVALNHSSACNLGRSILHKPASRSTLRPEISVVGPALPGQAFFHTISFNFSPANARGFFFVAVRKSTTPLG